MDPYVKTLEYVDVRGIYPMYVRGQLAVMLEGKSRDITLEDARYVASKLLGMKF